MTLRFASLGSGSRGNALLVELDETLLMVDCGLTLKSTEARLKALGREPRAVTALLVTHEHTDHMQGVGRFARRYNTPVWMTPGTAAAASMATLSEIRTFNCHRELHIGGIEVQPFPVPHDAREPTQFVFRGAGRRLGLLTDTGHVTPHIAYCLTGCDALAIECNHDLETLLGGQYPESVKRRIASELGHLNNSQAAGLVDAIRHAELQWVVALHLSEQNNSPDRVRESLSGLLQGSGQELHIAEQHAAGDWLDIV